MTALKDQAELFLRRFDDALTLDRTTSVGIQRLAFVIGAFAVLSGAWFAGDYYRTFFLSPENLVSLALRVIVLSSMMLAGLFLGSLIRPKIYLLLKYPKADSLEFITRLTNKKDGDVDEARKKIVRARSVARWKRFGQAAAAISVMLWTCVGALLWRISDGGDVSIAAVALADESGDAIIRATAHDGVMATPLSGVTLIFLGLFLAGFAYGLVRMWPRYEEFVDAVLSETYKLAENEILEATADGNANAQSFISAGAALSLTSIDKHLFRTRGAMKGASRP